jgi:hypothetical protein
VASYGSNNFPSRHTVYLRVCRNLSRWLHRWVLALLRIFAILSVSGTLPCVLQICPVISTSLTPIWPFFPEKVPPAHLTRWIIWYTSFTCSQIYVRMPGFSGRVSVGSVPSHGVSLPLIVTSSMKAWHIPAQISCSNICFIVAWYTATALV